MRRCIVLCSLALGAVAVVLLTFHVGPVASAAPPQGDGITTNLGPCGDCVDWEDFPDPEYDVVHQFPGGGDSFECESPGHPVHDCVDGDGSMWAPDSCGGAHDPCGEATIFLETQGWPESMTVAQAEEIHRLYEGEIEYVGGERILVRDCTGRVTGFVPVVDPEAGIVSGPTE